MFNKVACLYLNRLPEWNFFLRKFHPPHFSKTTFILKNTTKHHNQSNIKILYIV